MGSCSEFYRWSISSPLHWHKLRYNSLELKVIQTDCTLISVEWSSIILPLCEMISWIHKINLKYGLSLLINAFDLIEVPLLHIKYQSVLLKANTTTQLCLDMKWYEMTTERQRYQLEKLMSTVCWSLDLATFMRLPDIADGEGSFRFRMLLHADI